MCVDKKKPFAPGPAMNVSICNSWPESTMQMQTAWQRRGYGFNCIFSLVCSLFHWVTYFLFGTAWAITSRMILFLSSPLFPLFRFTFLKRQSIPKKAKIVQQGDAKTFTKCCLSAVFIPILSCNDENTALLATAKTETQRPLTLEFTS
ncbi:hypothetical protein FKM82_012309 [Ascaphus truei]